MDEISAPSGLLGRNRCQFGFGKREAHTLFVRIRSDNGIYPRIYVIDRILEKGEGPVSLRGPTAEGLFVH